MDTSLRTGYYRHFFGIQCPSLRQFCCILSHGYTNSSLFQPYFACLYSLFDLCCIISVSKKGFYCFSKTATLLPLLPKWKAILLPLLPQMKGNFAPLCPLLRRAWFLHHTPFCNNNFTWTRAWNVMGKVKNKLRKSLMLKHNRNMYFWTTMHKLSTNIWTWNILSFLAWGELTAFSLLLFAFHESVAPSETRYCANNVYLQLLVNFFQQNTLVCKRDHLGCSIWLMSSQSIKISNVVLHIV